MGKFARTTTVSVEKSKAEIERTVVRYGASGFFSGFTDDKAVVGFQIDGRMVKIVMDMPRADDKEFTYGGRWDTELSNATALKNWEQACRQLWRALALIVKAKLEAVECGISTVEREFLADIVMKDGTTFGQWAGPQLEAMYESGNMPPLLMANNPPPKKKRTR